MRYGRAFASGVAGGLVMTILMTLGRTVDIPLSFEAILGTLVGLGPGWTAWLVGFALHLVLAGVTAFLYAWGFAHLPGHGNRVIGAFFGLAHGAVVGVLLGLVPDVPGRLPHLGFFMSALGPVGVVATFLLHFGYGAVVGWAYGDLERALEPGQVVEPRRVA